MKLIEAEVQSIAKEGVHYRMRLQGLEKPEPGKPARLVDFLLPEPPALTVGKQYAIIAEELPAPPTAKP